MKVNQFCLTGRYYTALISTTAPKLRVILVLNTNLYSGSNQVTKDDADPGNQFQWLENEQQKAVNDNEKVKLEVTRVLLALFYGSLEMEKRMDVRKRSQ